MSKPLGIICVYLLLGGLAELLLSLGFSLLDYPLNCELLLSLWRIACSLRGYDPGSTAQHRAKALWHLHLKSMLPPPVCSLAFVLNKPSLSSEGSSVDVFGSGFFLFYSFMLPLPLPPYSSSLIMPGWLCTKVGIRFGLKPVALSKHCLLFSTIKEWNSYCKLIRKFRCAGLEVN